MSSSQIEPAAIATSGALAQIVGTGSVRGGLQRIEENVRDVIDVCRERGFVQRYGGDREFFGLPAWQLLGMAYGLLPFVESTARVDDGWEARAVVRTVEGVDVGAAEAMCTRAEPNRRKASDHDLRAMAQTRAQRNALRSVLGSALVLAGFDFADPDAPATRDQVKAVWTLAGLLGYERDEAHERAGVSSMLQLTREQASELIANWGTAAPAAAAAGEADRAATASASPATREPSPSASVHRASSVEGHGARAPAVATATASAGDAGGEGPHDPAEVEAEHGPLFSSPWARYNTALQALPKPELARAILRAPLRKADREYPPGPDWPAEILDELAGTLESAAGHPAGADR